MNNRKETLDQYFLYNREPEQIREVFLELDKALKIIHSRGFYVDVNASSIVNENGLGFKNYYSGLNDSLKIKNIEDLAKLAIGTYFSLPTGTFTDYTHLPNDYIRDNFDIIETSVLKVGDDDNYYRDVLVNGNIGYYTDYLEKLNLNKSSRGNNNSHVLTYSTPVGRAMTNSNENKEGAYIELAFYPIIITLTIIMSYMIYILIK